MQTSYINSHGSLLDQMAPLSSFQFPEEVVQEVDSGSDNAEELDSPCSSTSSYKVEAAPQHSAPQPAAPPAPNPIQEAIDDRLRLDRLQHAQALDGRITKEAAMRTAVAGMGAEDLQELLNRRAAGQ